MSGVAVDIMRRRLIRLLGYVMISILLLRIFIYICFHWTIARENRKNENERIPQLYVKDIELDGNKGTTANIKAETTEKLWGKVNVYAYRDVCSFTDTYNLYWNPLFPNFPYSTYFASKLEDNGMLYDTISRRFVGYLRVNTTGYYTFQMQSRNGIEFVLYDEQIAIYKTIARFGIYDREIRQQSATNPLLFSRISKEILLVKNKIYVIDLVQTVLSSGMFLLRFKTRKETHYSPIQGRNIAPYNAARDSIPDNYFYKAQSLLRDSFKKDARLSFNNARLTSGTLPTGLKACPYKPNYLFQAKQIRLYIGQYYVKNDLIYPDDRSGFVKFGDKINKLLNASIAKNVAEDIFTSINNENQRYIFHNFVLIMHLVFAVIKRYIIWARIDSKGRTTPKSFEEYYDNNRPYLVYTCLCKILNIKIEREGGLLSIKCYVKTIS